MAYQPRFGDARVQRRIQRAIGFACGVMSATEPREWSTRYIDQWFGSQRNDLGRYLREQLLTVTDPSYRWGDKRKCKEYILNTAGVKFLCEATGIVKDNNPNNYPIVVKVVESEYSQELQTGRFTYRDQSQRLWHPMQNFRREIKREVLVKHGFVFHYDIECCAMTLIHQHAQQIPQEPMDLYLSAIHEYLQNRQAIRQQIAAAADLDPDTVKRIINALLAGAKLSRNRESQIYHMLNGDCARIEFLQQHEYLTQLRADIRTCWDYITPTLPRRSRTQPSGRERMLPISSRQKWGVYFDLERRVLNEIRDFLCETNNKHFLEHDGWSCEREIDTISLSQRISERTGFRVNFEIK